MAAGRYLNPWADEADAIPQRPLVGALIFAATLVALAILGLFWWHLAGSADF